MLHHRTLFPLIVVGLTIVLGAMIFALFEGRVREGNDRTPVTSVEYQSAVHAVAGGLPTRLEAAATDADRAVILEKTREDVLALIVPVEYQAVHLDMVVTLSSWI